MTSKFGRFIWGRGVKVRYVSAEIGDLPNCIRFGKIKITRKTTAAQLAKIFSRCQKEVMASGGSSIDCDGIVIGTGGWGGKQKTPTLTVNAN